MALPTILVDSATGNDTTASGAGPSTALSGTTNASTDGAGTTVTLPAGTNLTGVATDGSHVIFLLDTTAGARNFGKITGSAGSGGATPTVTVANAFGLTLTNKTWAIGGLRASIGSTTSKKLFDNNSGNGDALPGWIIEMSSGHTETIAATFDNRRSGDTTNGPIILRGASGAATVPIVTFSNNGDAIVVRGFSRQYRDFELRNSNATKTASQAFLVPDSIGSGGGSPSGLIIERVKIAHSTNKFWKGCTRTGNGTYTIKDCEIGYCASNSITDSAASVNIGGLRLLWNYIHDCGAALNLGANHYFELLVYGNILYNNTGIGISYNNVGADNLRGAVFMQNTVDSCTSDGFKFLTASENTANLTVVNNIASNNGGIGFNFSAAGFTANYRDAQGIIINGNDTYNNSGGAYNPSGYGSNDPAANPSYVAASSGNFAVGTGVAALGLPITNVGSFSSTRSYVDIGAAQRIEPTGGGSAVAIFG